MDSPRHRLAQLYFRGNRGGINGHTVIARCKFIQVRGVPVVFHNVVINWCAEEIEAQRSIKQLLPGGHADDKRCFLHFDRGFRRGFCQGLSYAQFYLVKADLMPLFTVRSFLLSSEHEADIGFLVGRLGCLWNGYLRSSHRRK